MSVLMTFDNWGQTSNHRWYIKHYLCRKDLATSVETNHLNVHEG
jgi:hypothetical protein